VVNDAAPVAEADAADDDENDDEDDEDGVVDLTAAEEQSGSGDQSPVTGSLPRR
jgi:hypothetical protein